MMTGAQMGSWVHKPRSSKHRPGTGSPPGEAELALLTPASWPPGLQACESIHLGALTPPAWYRPGCEPAPGNWSRP